MNRKIGFFLVLVALMFLGGCEERVELDVDLDDPVNTLFCELIGLKNVGFYGVLSRVQSIHGNENTNVNANIKIWENGQLVIDMVNVQKEIFINHEVRTDVSYELQVSYNEHLVSAIAEPNNLENIEMNNLSVSNEYVDSLGIFVVRSTFDFDSYYYEDSIFYSTNFVLEDGFTSGFALNDFSLSKLFPSDNTTFINHLIPNNLYKHSLRSSVFVYDKPLYQYLKSITKVGEIPNDDIEGHHGNLTGGVGFFGVVSFDSDVSFF